MTRRVSTWLSVHLHTQFHVTREGVAGAAGREELPPLLPGCCSASSSVSGPPCALSAQCEQQERWQRPPDCPSPWPPTRTVPCVFVIWSASSFAIWRILPVFSLRSGTFGRPTFRHTRGSDLQLLYTEPASPFWTSLQGVTFRLALFRLIFGDAAKKNAKETTSWYKRYFNCRHFQRTKARAPN